MLNDDDDDYYYIQILTESTKETQVLTRNNLVHATKNISLKEAQARNIIMQRDGA